LPQRFARGERDYTRGIGTQGKLPRILRLRIGRFSLQMWLSHFGAKDGQLHCISTSLRAARYKYLPILKRKIRGKIWDKGGLHCVVPRALFTFDQPKRLRKARYESI